MVILLIRTVKMESISHFEHIKMRSSIYFHNIANWPDTSLNLNVCFEIARNGNFETDPETLGDGKDWLMLQRAVTQQDKEPFRSFGTPEILLQLMDEAQIYEGAIIHRCRLKF